MKRIIILNEKQYLIERILKVLEHKPIKYKVDIEIFLNKQKISFLKEFLREIKPKKPYDEMLHLPKQTILSNKDIIFNALNRKHLKIENKGLLEHYLKKSSVSKNRLKKIFKHKKPLFNREKEKIGLYLKHLQANTKNRVGKNRARQGVTFTTLISGELRNIKLNNSGLSKLVSACKSETDMKLVNRIITKEVKLQQKLTKDLL